MLRNELLEILSGVAFIDRDELRTMNKAELEELYQEIFDQSDLYPNGEDDS